MAHLRFDACLPVSCAGVALCACLVLSSPFAASPAHADTVSTGEASVASVQESAALQPATVNLQTKVSVSGADIVAGAYQFKITLIDGAPEPSITMAVNDQDGTVSFGTASFTQAGTYTYKVVQVPGDAEGMTYDSSTITFKVTVKENTEKTALVGEVKASSAKGFVNGYKKPSTTASDSAVASLSDYEAASAIITATVTQASGKPAAGSLSFDVVDEAGDVVTTGTNDANGTVRFSAIELNEAGDYIYSVQPSEGTTLSAVASSGQSQVFRVEVKVEDTGTGLLATVSYPDGKPNFAANGAVTKEKLANSAASSEGSQDGAQDAGVSGADAAFSISPVAVGAAVVGVAVLAVAVVCIVRLQGRGSKKNGSHAAGKGGPSRCTRPMQAVDPAASTIPVGSQASRGVDPAGPKDSSDDSGVK